MDGKAGSKLFFKVIVKRVNVHTIDYMVCSFKLLYEMLAPLTLIEFIFVTASLYQSNSHHCTQWVNCHLSQWNFRFLLACNRYSDFCKGFNTCCNDDTVSELVRFSDSLAFGSALQSKWKWSNGVRRSEMSIISYISKKIISEHLRNCRPITKVFLLFDKVFYFHCSHTTHLPNKTLLH